MQSWLPSACAPTDFPVRLLEARFLHGDETMAQVPRSVCLYNGWGEEGLVSLGARADCNLPDSLRIAWFSLAEDCFYGADFDLPVDKLAGLLESGMVHPETGLATRWTTLLIGMAPGGRLTLWLTGGGLAVELCRAVAPVEPMPWSIMPASDGFDRADYVQTHLLKALGPAGLVQHRSRAVDLARWDRLQSRQTWSVEWIGPAATASVRLRCLNGEREHLDQFSQSRTAVARPRGLPTSMVIRWTDDIGQRRVAQVKLDPDEVEAAFVRLASPDRAPLMLQVDVSEPLEGARLFLCDRRRCLELLEGDFRTYLAA